MARCRGNHSHLRPKTCLVTLLHPFQQSAPSPHSQTLPWLVSLSTCVKQLNVVMVKTRFPHAHVLLYISHGLIMNVGKTKACSNMMLNIHVFLTFHLVTIIWLADLCAHEGNIYSCIHLDAYYISLNGVRCCIFLFWYNHHYNVMNIGQPVDVCVCIEAYVGHYNIQSQLL